MKTRQAPDTFDELRSNAMRLVETLDARELQVLVCLARGLSRKDIASCLNLSRKEVELAFASVMKKLKGKPVADPGTERMHYIPLA